MNSDSSDKFAFISQHEIIENTYPKYFKIAQRMLSSSISEVKIDEVFIRGSHLRGRLTVGDLSYYPKVEIDIYKWKYHCTCSEVSHRKKGCVHTTFLLVAVVNKFVEPKIDPSLKVISDAEALDEKAKLEAQKSFEDLKMKRELANDVLGKLERELLHLVTLGLQRSSVDTLDVINQLAIKAHAAKLVKIERELQSLITTISAYLVRDEIFDSWEYLRIINNISNLVRLTQSFLEESGTLPSSLTALDLIGTPRAKYIPTSQRDVQCIGTMAWETSSGFIGITTYLWDIQHKEILTFSNVRPVHLGSDFRYLWSTPTYVMNKSIQELSRDRLILFNPKINLRNAISLSKELTLKNLQPLPLSDETFSTIRFEEWIPLLDVLRKNNPTPIPTRKTTQQSAIVCPTWFGDLTEDQIDNSLTTQLIDNKHRELLVKIKADSVGRNVISNIKFLWEKKKFPNAFFGYFYNFRGSLAFFPRSAIYYDGIKIRSPNRRTTIEDLLHITIDDYSDKVVL